MPPSSALTELDTFPRLLLNHAAIRAAHPATREKDLGIWQTWTWSQVTDEVRALTEHMRSVMHGREDPDEDRLGDGIALAGVRKFPARVKCALLSWMALKDAIATDQERANGH